MIYYIGYYSPQDNQQTRKIILSAVNKMDYIINTINSLGDSQTIVSCSETKEKRGYMGEEIQLKDNINLKTFRTFGRKNAFTKLADMVFIKLQMFFYLLKRLKKDDIMLVYHSPYYCNTVKFLRKIKKCRLILEMEELYSDVSGDKKLRGKELSVCRSADAFIFPTELLNAAVNCKGKPFSVIHGTYNVENERERIFNDGKIHVVYAGTFDPRKGGAVAAIAAGEFLPEKYHIHILGFGSDKEKADIKNQISEVSKKTKATVTYDGLLSGEEYIRFIQSCDIGLSTQNPDAEFNSTSFPSKILSYMANGLRVVSIKIPAIEKSAVGNYMYYYQKQTPAEIAEAIKSVDLNDDYNGREIISNLSDKFCNNLNSILEDLKNEPA